MNRKKMAYICFYVTYVFVGNETAKMMWIFEAIRYCFIVSFCMFLFAIINLIFITFPISYVKRLENQLFWNQGRPQQPRDPLRT